MTISWISVTVPDKDPLHFLAAKIENIMHIYSISHNNDIHFKGKLLTDTMCFRAHMPGSV